MLPAMQRKTGVIVVTHGSQIAIANDAFVRLAQRLRRRLDTDLIEPCFMEFGEPSILVAIERLLARGCNHIFVYSCFLVPGKHLQEDIPAIINWVLQNHTEVTYEITEPMLKDSDLLELVAKRLERALHHPPPSVTKKTACPVPSPC
jgi:sirohydrochlorin ferrochelatase